MVDVNKARSPSTYLQLILPGTCTITHMGKRGITARNTKKLYVTGLRPLMSLTHGTYFDYFPTDFHGFFFSLNLAKSHQFSFTRPPLYGGNAVHFTETLLGGSTVVS